MAGSAMTFTEVTYGTIKKIKAAWVSDDATGAVSGTTMNTMTAGLSGPSPCRTVPPLPQTTTTLP
jgi:hypothetical protein